MSGFKGDYLGFSYGKNAEGNPMHSSELGIVRTSNGSRFNESLLPTIQDKTVQVPGGDGTYFFASYYTQRQFSVSFAFDHLTEDQLRRLRAHFGDKQIHDLTFDEAPYKTYRAKVTGTAQIKHLVFDEEVENETQRIYKGEGTIQFTCYSPYAICTRKGLEDYEDWELTGQWEVASGLPEKWEEFTSERLRTGRWDFINAGDIEAPFQFSLGFLSNRIGEGTLYLDGGSHIDWNQMTAQTDTNGRADDGVIFDTSTNLIEGYIVTNQETGEIQKTGHVYNQYISGGDFFRLPIGESYLTLSDSAKSQAVFFRYDYYYI